MGKIKKIKDKKNDIYYCKEDYLWIYTLIEEKKYKIMDILKDDHRSFVAKIKLENQENREVEVILKVPKEKNTRKNVMFFSIFKGGESKKEFKGLKKILDNDFLGAVPLIAVEKKKKLMVFDSYLVMSLINGRPKDYNDIPVILPTLYKIHDKGFLHGDPQLSNFIVGEEGVYIIDSKLLINRLGPYCKIKEILYFEKSCYREVKNRYQSYKIYEIIKKTEILKDKLNYISKKIRRK